MNCPKCGFYNQLESSLCGSCGRVLLDASVKGKSPVSSLDDNNPWCAPEALESPFKALWFTFVKSIVQPGRIFKSQTRSGPIWQPLLYALLTGSIGIVASCFWSQIVQSPIPDDSLLSDTVGTGDFSPAYLICSPIIIIVQLALASLYIQGTLFISRSRKAPLKETFRAVCFAEGAMLLQIVPGIGLFAAGILWLVIIINGTAVVHTVSRLRVILALSAPLIICLFISLFLIMLLVLLGVAGSLPI